MRSLFSHKLTKKDASRVRSIQRMLSIEVVEISNYLNQLTRGKQMQIEALHSGPEVMKGKTKAEKLRAFDMLRKEIDDEIAKHQEAAKAEASARASNQPGDGADNGPQESPNRQAG